MLFKTRPTHPIEILKWEHEIFLKRLQSLEHGIEDTQRVAGLLRDIEEHQEAEERFVFPLILDHQGELPNLLRKQHLEISNSSDKLLALVNDRAHLEIIRFLKGFSKQLIMHFETERGEIFDKVSTKLNEAQIDVLRIKFATRKIHFM